MRRWGIRKKVLVVTLVPTLLTTLMLGLFFMASFFRYFIGQESDFAAYWTGLSKVPPSACPGELEDCPGRYHLSVQPAAVDRLLIDATPDDTSFDLLYGLHGLIGHETHHDLASLLRNLS